MACKLLEEEGVFGYVNILEYPLGLIPLDSDIFTLEIGNTDLSYFLVRANLKGFLMTIKCDDL